MNSIRGQLKDLMGETYKELLEVFLSDSPKRLEKIRLAAQENDMDALAREAHALKGGSSNLGAQQLSVVCGEIEKLAQTPSAEGLSSILGEVEKSYQDLKKELEEELSSL